MIVEKIFSYNYLKKEYFYNKGENNERYSLGSSFQIAKNKLKEIEEQYERLGYKPLTKRNGNASNTYELVYANGDMWQAVRAGENARGYKANISYIDRSISDYLIDVVIKPATVSPPYTAIHYFYP